jgi:hypothetical protein
MSTRLHVSALRVAVVAAAALFLPLLVPLVTGRIFVIDDLAVLHLPLRLLYKQALDSGASILWTSQLFNGYFVHAEGQLGALHPAHLITYWLMPVPVGLNFEIVFIYAFSFAGMWLFLVRHGLSAPAACVGATAFSFGGFNLLRINQLNVIAVAAHLPWLLVGLDMSLTGTIRRRGMGLVTTAFLIGSQVLLGHPQSLWLSALTCATYVAVRAGNGVPLMNSMFAAVAGLVGLVIGAAQLLPTYEFLGHSSRIEVSTDFFLSLSLHPFNLSQLVSPYLYPQRAYVVAGETYPHEFIVYPGVLAVFALVWTLGRNRSPRWGELRTLGLALAVLGGILALGRYGGLYYLLSYLPLLGKFRGASRHLLLFHLGLAVMLAIFYEDLLDRSHRESESRRSIRWLWIPICLSALTVCGVWVGKAAFPDSVKQFSLLGGMIGLPLIGVATLVATDAARGSRIALLALPVFGALDLGLWGYTFVWSTPPRSLEQLRTQAAWPEGVISPVSLHLPEANASRNLVMLRGARLFWGFMGLAPATVLPTEDAVVHQLAGVDWIYRNRTWTPVTSPMPRVRVVTEYQHSEKPAEDLHRIDISKTALVSDALPALDRGGRFDTHVSRDDPGYIDIDVVSTGRALLVTTERYHADWSATAGARRLAIVPVYGDFLGVVLDPGTYTVSLRFQSGSTSKGIAASLVGLCLLGCAALWLCLRAP